MGCRWRVKDKFLVKVLHCPYFVLFFSKAIFDHEGSLVVSLMLTDITSIDWSC